MNDESGVDISGLFVGQPCPTCEGRRIVVINHISKSWDCIPTADRLPSLNAFRHTGQSK